MLCPEVWNFKAPESHFDIEKGYHAENKCVEKINNFFYNHLITFVLPDTLRTPEHLSELLTVDTEYYKVTSFSVDELVNEEFVENFIKKGSLTLLSIGVRIDCEDCICVTPTGQLILSLTKENYQSLGIPGRLSHFSQHSKSRYIVRINLFDDSFKSSKKLYEHTKSCLRKVPKFTVLINWYPPTVTVCPSSIAYYFNNRGYQVQECKPELKVRTEYSVRMPTIDIQNADEDDVHNFVEWLGMLALGGDTETGAPDDFLTTYQNPEPTVEVGQVRYLEIQGLFHIRQIEDLYKELEKVIQREGDKKWVAMYVQGFSDSPVNWGLQEHHFYTNGDNSYVLIMTPMEYLLYKQRCSNKYYQYK